MYDIAQERGHASHCKYRCHMYRKELRPAQGSTGIIVRSNDSTTARGANRAEANLRFQGMICRELAAKILQTKVVGVNSSESR